MQWFASLQPALVGGVLLWAATVKLFGRSAPLAARRSALARLVGADRAPGAYRLVGCVELAVAGLLLLPPVHPAEAGAAVALGLGMLGYLGYARLAAPESSCGCLGEKHAPVRARSFARAAVLVVSGVLAVWAADWWALVLLERPFATVAVLVGTAAVIVALSPELDRNWLLPLRRLRLRISHPLARQPFTVPLHSTVQQLHRSDAYRSVAGLLHSDVLETWDEGDWRILTFSARRPGTRRGDGGWVKGESGPATAVFAVPRLRYDPDGVRVVLVADTEEAALA